jgi:uncharacterized protein YndB with AHSA1/START domain
VTLNATEILEREVRIGARPEIIFSFFTDPVKLVRWKGIDAKLDPRPGGVFRVDINGHDVARGEYVEITPYTRVVFTWGWEGGPLQPGASTVEISLTPEGGETIVRLRHRGLPESALHAHAVGWDYFLPRLVQAAEGREPGPGPAAGPM